MPEVLRPNGSTTRTPPAGHSVPSVVGQTTMHGCMDKVGPVGADYTQCQAGSVGDVLVVELGSPTETPTTDYNHIVACSMSKNTSGGKEVRMRCELRQGYNSETAVADSTANLNEDLDATEVVVTVTDGSLFAAGDVIRIDGEEMIITSIATNDLTVTRGTGGTAGAIHNSGVDVLDINQGSLIASFVCTSIPDTVDTYFRYRCTNDEASRITDYTDLQLRFVTLPAAGSGATRNARLHWGGMQIPTPGESRHMRLTDTEDQRNQHGAPVTQELDRRTSGNTSRPF